MQQQSKWRPYILTIIGAACWGVIGLFIQPLYDRGFTAWDVVTIRGVLTFIFLIVFMLASNPKSLKTRWQDHVYFAGAGILSMVFFNYLYFETFSQSSLSLAVTLLYTGPIFVTLLSRIFFKEPLNSNKIIALILAITGCGFVVGLLPSFKVEVSTKVIVTGILSGVCYSLYTIFTKPVTKRYSALTITTYNFLYTSLFMLIFSKTPSKIEKFTHPDVIGASIGLAFISTVMAYVLYTAGLKHLEASKASILATLEPIVAILTGVIFLGDVLNTWQISGIVTVMCAAVIVGRNPRVKGQEALSRY